MRRLAHSSTCSSLLIFNQTYEDSHDSHVLFEKELDLAFFESEGFDEGIYRNAYNQIERVTVIDLTDQEEEETTQEEINQQLRIDNTIELNNNEIINNEGKLLTS